MQTTSQSVVETLPIDSEKARVNIERRMYDYVRDYVAMESTKRECKFANAASLAEGLLQRHKELNRISPFFGYEPYPVYAPDWEAKRMRKLAGKTDGPEGHLIIPVPETALVHPDPNDEGRYERWQDSAFNASRWQSISTAIGWDAQGFTDPQGHSYRGIMWYRMDAEIPANAAGKSIWLFTPAVVNEAWVWVNGQYAGHRAHKMPWFRPQPVDLEITPFLKAGQKKPNHISRAQ